MAYDISQLFPKATLHFPKLDHPGQLRFLWTHSGDPTILATSDPNSTRVRFVVTQATTRAAPPLASIAFTRTAMAYGAYARRAVAQAATNFARFRLDAPQTSKWVAGQLTYLAAPGVPWRYLNHTGPCFVTFEPTGKYNQHAYWDITCSSARFFGDFGSEYRSLRSAISLRLPTDFRITSDRLDATIPSCSTPGYCGHRYGNTKWTDAQTGVTVDLEASDRHHIGIISFDVTVAHNLPSS